MLINFGKKGHHDGLPNIGTDASPTPTVSYHVLLFRGQRREHVSKDLLRRRMNRSDPVEMYSKMNGGRWIAGVINGPQVARATALGYQVLKLLFREAYFGTPQQSTYIFIYRF